jgi:hypothetical protein
MKTGDPFCQTSQLGGIDDGAHIFVGARGLFGDAARRDTAHQIPRAFSSSTTWRPVHVLRAWCRLI